MAIGTYEQYEARLLAMKPNVYLNGKKIDRSNGKTGAERDLADWIVGGTYVMKQCYDTANDPDYADVCVVKDPDGSVHDPSDLSSCRRLHAALHGHRRPERSVLRHLRLRRGMWY